VQLKVDGGKAGDHWKKGEEGESSAVGRESDLTLNLEQGRTGWRSPARERNTGEREERESLLEDR